MKRVCLYPGCSTITTGAYCILHNAPKADRDHARRYATDNTAEVQRVRNTESYRRFVRTFKENNPYCCNPFGDCDRATDHVHHVIPLHKAIQLAMEESNCVPICTECHARIEQMERKGIDTGKLFNGVGGLNLQRNYINREIPRVCETKKRGTKFEGL